MDGSSRSMEHTNIEHCSTECMSVFNFANKSPRCKKRQEERNTKLLKQYWREDTQQTGNTPTSFSSKHTIRGLNQVPAENLSFHFWFGSEAI